MDIVGLNRYFKDQKDIYVQNVSGTILSLGFKTESGELEPCTIPKSSDPFCISDLFPFELIKNSPEFRKMLQRKPPYLKLMTEEDFTKYYAERAKVAGKTTDEMAAEAQQAVFSVTYDKDSRPKVVPEKEEKKTASPDDEKEEKAPAPEINPQVLQMCLDMNPESEDKKKLKSNDAINLLKAMTLTTEDLNYLIGNSIRGVARWAKDELSKRVDEEVEEEDIAEEVTK